MKLSDTFDDESLRLSIKFKSQERTNRKVSLSDVILVYFNNIINLNGINEADINNTLWFIFNELINNASAYSVKNKVISVDIIYDNDELDIIINNYCTHENFEKYKNYIDFFEKKGIDKKDKISYLLTKQNNRCGGMGLYNLHYNLGVNFDFTLNDKEQLPSVITHASIDLKELFYGSRNTNNT